ncbi:hypothetical protein [Limimaricola litoreus]|uniref:Uncharacterized protein n=1 Tax=Limimaricola litoreus TaxID=2955316 RepID=A0A9X2FNK2_9RHOB|nr:hypothetical protein [Limimaricola litoreus]MCP1168409.1 hypothetical protein [Limimaricola litoreus]
MTHIVRTTVTIGLLTAATLAQAQSVPRQMEDFAALGWSIQGHIGQAEGQERMLVRDADGQDRIAVLHSYSGQITFEQAPHPAER